MVKISKDVPFNGVAGTNVWYGKQETQNKNDYLKNIYLLKQNNLKIMKKVNKYEQLNNVTT